MRTLEGQVALVTGHSRGSDQIEAMRRTIEDRLGAVDILVANAGGNLWPGTTPARSMILDSGCGAYFVLVTTLAASPPAA